MDRDQALISLSVFLEWCKSTTQGTIRGALTHLSAKRIPDAALSNGKYSSVDILAIKLALRSLRDIMVHMELRRIESAFDTMSISDSAAFVEKAAKSELSFAKWSDACRWMVVLNTVCVAEKRLGNTLMSATLRIVPQTISSVTWLLPDVRRWTAERQDLILMLIRHWVNEDVYVRDRALNWTTRLFAHSLEHIFQYIGDNGTTESTYDDLLKTFASAVEGGAKTITEVALQQLHTMLELKNPDFDVACMCLQLIYHFSKNAALRASLLQNGIIRATTQFLALLDVHPPPDGIPQPLQHFFMESIMIYVRYLETANGPTVVAKVLDEGILGGFLRALPWLMCQINSDIYPEVSKAFFGYLVPFLTYRSVLRSSSAALRQVGSLGLDVDITSKCEEWKTFFLSATDSLQQKSKYDERIASSGSCSCENTDCHLRSTTIQYRRCSGCSTVMYCSRFCQKLDWPRHRVICKAIQKQLSEGVQLPISHYDRGFIHYLIFVNMDRCCTQLRERAKKEFPSAPLSSLLVHMLFTFGNPPLVKISLAETHTWDDDERLEMEFLLNRAREREGQRTLVTAMVREGYSDDTGPGVREFPFLLYHSDSWLVKHPSSWGDGGINKK